MIFFCFCITVTTSKVLFINSLGENVELFKRISYTNTVTENVIEYQIDNKAQSNPVYGYGRYSTDELQLEIL